MTTFLKLLKKSLHLMTLSHPLGRAPKYEIHFPACIALKDVTTMTS